jgi:hypothetical protein
MNTSNGSNVIAFPLERRGTEGRVLERQDGRIVYAAAAEILHGRIAHVAAAEILERMIERTMRGCNG